MPPLSRARVPVIFLPRQKGRILDELVILTSVGTLTIVTVGHGLRNNYHLKAFTGIKIPVDTKITPAIHVYNPHNKVFHVTEVFTTESFLHLSLPESQVSSQMVCVCFFPEFVSFMVVSQPPLISLLCLPISQFCVSFAFWSVCVCMCVGLCGFRKWAAPNSGKSAHTRKNTSSIYPSTPPNRGSLPGLYTSPRTITTSSFQQRSPLWKVALSSFLPVSRAFFPFRLTSRAFMVASVYQ